MYQLSEWLLRRNTSAIHGYISTNCFNETFYFYTCCDFSNHVQNISLFPKECQNKP